MGKHGNKDEWLRDVDARQRNIVFPDTANNEARFWRNIINGNARLSTTQKIGILLVFLTLLVVFLSMAGVFSSGFSFSGLASTSLVFLAGSGFLVLFLAIFSVSQWLGRASKGRRFRR
jgi:hypothetical protein